MAVRVKLLNCPRTPIFYTTGIRWTLMSLLEDLDFADDVALVSSTRDQLQRKTSDLSLAANQLGLNISRKKTKTMQLTETPLSVELENEISRK